MFTLLILSNTSKKWPAFGLTSIFIFQESKETKETNSNVTLPFDLVLITKCSGYFLSSVNNPNHGLPSASFGGQSSDVRYFLTLLWCHTLLYCSRSCFEATINGPLENYGVRSVGLEIYVYINWMTKKNW